MPLENILLSNDDGIESRGIWALKEHLEPYYNVYIVAPDRERSAAAHSISLHDPIRLKVVEPDRAFSVDGTPVDAVYVGLLGVLNKKIDAVITGINNGLNLGSDVFYSGTVSAAFQAAALNIPAVAVSIDNKGEYINYHTAAEVARRLLQKIDQYPPEKNVIYNVNVPNLPLEQIKGVEITRLGQRYYEDNLIEREDPRKNKYFWIEGIQIRDVLEQGTDVKALHELKISITPLRLDITAHDLIESLKKWKLHHL